MKSIMAAVLLTAATASPVLAQGQVPFRGTVKDSIPTWAVPSPSFFGV